MSLIRRTPKRGFTAFAKKEYQVANVERLNHFKKDTEINKAELAGAGIIKDSEKPVKILGNGKLTKPLVVTADAFSESAKKKITEAGGKCAVSGKAIKALRDKR